MLTITDLSFRHGERVLFDRASAAISDGWKVGLVGRNGAGKSTLLRLIQGHIEADGGNINMTGRTADRLGAAGPARRRHLRPRRGAGGRRRAHALLAEAETATTACAWPRSMPGSTRSAPRRRPARAASILHGLGFDTESTGAAVRRVLRRLAHARGAGRHAVQRSRPADPRRAVEPSRPRGAALAHRAPEALSAHAC